MSMRRNIAANIDRAIIASGRTNRSIAEELGVTEQQVWRWRHGRTAPSHPSLIGLAALLFDGDYGALYEDAV